MVMASSHGNGNTSRVTCHPWGESTGYQWTTSEKANIILHDPWKSCCKTVDLYRFRFRSIHFAVKPKAHYKRNSFTNTKAQHLIQDTAKWMSHDHNGACSGICSQFRNLTAIQILPNLSLWYHAACSFTTRMAGNICASKYILNE